MADRNVKMTSPILDGAEPWASSGDERGVLVLHGFTGTPQSMRGVAERLASDGFTVELPLLPGHGTCPEDLQHATWEDWCQAASNALQDLQDRCRSVSVVGLSMGGALACWLAARHKVAALALVNPAAVPMDQEVSTQLSWLLNEGTDFIPGIGSDIADPEGRELAYDRVPLRAALSLNRGLEQLVAELSDIEAPVLLLTSRVDHVVPPEAAAAISDGVQGPVKRVVLEKSYHVATLDLDRELIERLISEFLSSTP
jgi:carboxylesterase